MLRHEMEHVLNGDGRGEMNGEQIDVDLQSSGGRDDLPPAERKANAAAQDCCVPVTEMESFYTRKYPYIAEKDVVGFAGRLGGILESLLASCNDAWIDMIG